MRRWRRPLFRFFGEAVAAFRAALTERTRERVQLDWAKGTANLSVAHTLLAERTDDAQLAQTALSQIELALATARSSGDSRLVAFSATLLSESRDVVERLSNR
jgi:hypothetical protein